MTFMLPFGFNSMFIEIMNAYSGGHFARHGIDGKVLGATGTAQAVQQVVAGQAQFVVCSGLDFVRAVGSRNAPLRAIATIDQNAGFNLVSLKAKPIRKGEDLRGKTIGVVSQHGTTETCLDLLLALSHVPKSEVQVVVTRDTPGALEFIRQGRIDGFMTTYTVTLILLKQKAPIEYLLIDDFVPTPGEVYSTTTDIIAKRPQLPLAVLQAIGDSVVEIMSHPLKPIFARAAKDFDILGGRDLDGLASMEQSMIQKMWLADGKAELLHNVPRRWQTCVDSLHRLGFINSTDPAPFYTNEFVDQLKL
ncbi:MAG TPA: ABC transporter substrate-binding protein [Stellaceae bacterium]|nr:ABC transporter substrate-binding protein [Stellaceae bacterium]